MKKKAIAPQGAAPQLISTFAAACEFLQLSTELPNLDFAPERHRKALLAHYQLLIIAQALNRQANAGQDWNPDWNDYDQYKYYPWFDMETYGDAPAGSGFAFFDFGFVAAVSRVGSRLCFKTSELAKHAGTTFLDLYRDSFLISQ